MQTSIGCSSSRPVWISSRNISTQINDLTRHYTLCRSTLRREELEQSAVQLDPELVPTLVKFPVRHSPTHLQQFNKQPHSRWKASLHSLYHQYSQAASCHDPSYPHGCRLVLSNRQTSPRCPSAWAPQSSPAQSTVATKTKQYKLRQYGHKPATVPPHASHTHMCITREQHENQALHDTSIETNPHP